jgi:hypothetical protein
MGAVFDISLKCTLSGRFDELRGKLAPNYQMKDQVIIDNADYFDDVVNLVRVIWFRWGLEKYRSPEVFAMSMY